MNSNTINVQPLTRQFPGQFAPFIKRQNSVSFPTGLNEYVLLKSFKEGALIIPYSKIVRVEAAKSYSMFYFTDGTRFFSSHNLSFHMRQLDQRYFQRIHKSHIINLHQVKEILTDKVKKVRLFDDSLIEVSRRKATAFIRMFKIVMAASF